MQKKLQYLQHSQNGPDTLVDKSSFEKKVICYYFSASWCGPCKQFTPLLSKFYNEVNKNEKRLEIIFMSLDKSQQEMLTYFKKMPWIAHPAPQQQLFQDLGGKGIPALYIMNHDGSVASTEGRSHISSGSPEETFQKWKKMRKMQNFEGKSFQLSPDKQKGVVGTVDLKAAELKCNTSKPSAQLRIKLNDGKGQILRVKVNTDDKVQVLLEYLDKVAPVEPIGFYELIYGYPKKALTNPNQTFKEADMVNCEVIQHIK